MAEKHQQLCNFLNLSFYLEKRLKSDTIGIYENNRILMRGKIVHLIGNHTMKKGNKLTLDNLSQKSGEFLF